ncbi:phosphatase PAP2 family protein [Bacillus sp. 3103sda1]|uniref:phosphatase PAP2 family protein n=1 Tax=Bacillus sp. 3103sda1 TaxID=2953808 RepID=UPI00209F85B8|nr:phosphatase PAP2 family protein [Bacillus sp. 3103sda1]MCP1125871.1 phosphatase PAP2 family protein [Bacillus sp. 3103sda1]
MENNQRSSFLPLCYILLLILVGLLYDVLNQSTVGAVNVTTKIDAWIPFTKEFIVPYLLWFPYLYGTLIYYCFADRKLYYVTLSSVILGDLLSFGIYYMWQTTVTRPEVIGNDVFANLVRFIYSIDQPVNCFPSIHVLTTFVIMITAYKRKKQNKWEYGLLTFVGVLIILSTLFTKQHAFIDVITGIVVASFLYAAMQSVFELRKQKVKAPAG